MRRPTLFLLVFLPLLAYRCHQSPQTGAQTPQEGSPVASLDRAALAELISLGRHAQAYPQLLRLAAEAATPQERAELEFQLALCEKALGKPKPAYARLQALRGALPPLEDYRRLWAAGCLEEMGDPSAAAAYDELVLSCSHPDIAVQAGMRLARLAARRGDHATVLRACRAVLSRSPQQAPEALLLTASTHAAGGDTAQARTRWRELVRRHPASAQALTAAELLGAPAGAEELLARVAVSLAHRRHGEGIRQLERFLRAYPAHRRAAEAREMRARALADQGDYDAALKAYEDLYKRYKQPSALFRIGRMHVRRDEDEAAIRAWERLLRLHPRDAQAAEGLWQAAKAAERQEQFARAEGFYRRLAEGYPASEHGDEAGWCVGFMAYCRGDYQRALTAFERRSRAAREPHILDQSLFWAGKTAERLGQSARAQRFYRQAARSFPRSYYAARAVERGFGPDSLLAALPRLAGVASVAELSQGGECLRRAELLHALGEADLCRQELQLADRHNDGNAAALRLIRDRCEAYGMPDLAMRLTARTYPGQGDASEFRHLYPRYYWAEITRSAEEAGADPYLVLSVIRQESSFRRDAVSPAGAMGLMQIMPKTGRALADTLRIPGFEERALLDPVLSIRMGSRFLGDQVRQFGSGPAGRLGFELGLAAYNAGPHNVRRWLEHLPHQDADAFVERIPYQETRQYVKLVLRNYTIYKVLSNA
ncbi:MAG: transglycosylase SLT domain-containing protein [Candidatus Latescibacterota bacterium]